MKDFLPISKEDMNKRGWSECDFIIVTGDAYVDHPTFGTAIISRVIEDMGFRVGIISQPINDSDYKSLGTPKYAFMVNSGNIDSMVAHYTAAKRKRSEDAYTPGGVAGKRPDRAVTVYTQKIKKLFGDVPVIIGGLEASLRRFAHYDYWSDSVRPSILVESGADLLSFGMGENITREICSRLKNGEKISDLTDIRGTCYLSKTPPIGEETVSCASFEKVRENKLSYAKSARIQQDEQDAINGRIIIQKHGEKYLVQNKPMPPLKREELDRVYALPFMRTYHPSYESLGGVPGIEEVEFSITHNRGCFGNCNFCSIAFHQGRTITSRSEQSVLEEAEKLTKLKNFKGYIHDVGGPTANFRYPSCDKQKTLGMCKGKKCLAPKPCPQLKVSHEEYLKLLRKIREIPKIKKVFIRSGIRYDYLILDENKAFFKELVQHHTSGQLKVAPEHCSSAVLDKMGKPHFEAYQKFSKEFYNITKSVGKEQYLVPYLMSSHPGSTLNDAVELALYLKKNKIRPEQVQDFYPTPGTISTAMFYTELDPYTLNPVFVAKTPEEKSSQRILLQYYKPENRRRVIEALIKAKRRDLIGTSPDCLVPPDREYAQKQREYQKRGEDKWQNKRNRRNRR